MAIAVIVGIIFATFLTLIVVPVMYSLVDDAAALFRTHFVGEIAGTNRTDGVGAGAVPPPPLPHGHEDNGERVQEPETVGAAFRRGRGPRDSAKEPSGASGFEGGLDPHSA